MALAIALRGLVAVAVATAGVIAAPASARVAPFTKAVAHRTAATDPSNAEAVVRQGVNTYIQSIDAADTELAGRIFQTTPDTFFIHPRGTERGWDAVVANFYGKTMRDSFSKRTLQLAEPVRVHVHGSSAVAEFSWKFDAVFRRDGKPLHTEGRESQTWASLPGLGWRIVAVHYSGLPVTDAGQGF